MTGEAPQCQGKKEKDGEVVVSKTPVGGEEKREGARCSDKIPTTMNWLSTETRGGSARGKPSTTRNDWGEEKKGQT